MKIFPTVLIVAALTACPSDAPQPLASDPSAGVQPDRVPAPGPEIAGRIARVKRVVDGDTIVLENGERLRYIGIDTPEEFDRRKPVQCFAKEAAEANRQLVEGKTIVYSYDTNERDKYGRLLGYVWLKDARWGKDGSFVNERLIRDGYAFAWAYGKDRTHADTFAAAEADAKAHRRGLWASCQVTATKSGRRQTQAVSK